VCFRYRGSDRLNADIVVALQEAGVVAPSSTTIQGHLAIRAAIVNHRTQVCDVDALVDAVLALGLNLTDNAQAGHQDTHEYK
jgi:aromatic-L-amino-acid decarboxylase